MVAFTVVIVNRQDRSHVQEVWEQDLISADHTHHNTESITRFHGLMFSFANSHTYVLSGLVSFGAPHR